MKRNYYLFVCQLFICFIPALSIAFCASENWPALILSILLCVSAIHEIRKEKSA